ncbi:hypothetical protein LCGC14_2022220, partial [marine sediment metagenome]
MQPKNHWDAQLYNDKHHFVYEYGSSLIDLLEPKSDERILDLGCGSGELTAEIGLVAKSVLGIDKSHEMILKAREQFPYQYRSITWQNDRTSYLQVKYQNGQKIWQAQYQSSIE